MIFIKSNHNKKIKYRYAPIGIIFLIAGEIMKMENPELVIILCRYFIKLILILNILFLMLVHIF